MSLKQWLINKDVLFLHITQKVAKLIEVGDFSFLDTLSLIR